MQEAASKREFQSGTPVISLFDELNGAMLILGAPGSGKTTLLLELARDLIVRARNDAQHPLPLVFNLSTWASKRQPLKEWLAQELNQRYEVPSKLATAWVEADAILPLLDGLDEVDVDHRNTCVEAINVYRQERGLVKLVVCSRVEEYEQLTEKLKLQGAVIIQPLTEQTVDTYLRQVGRPLSAVRAALRDDPTLWELLDSPLLLSIVALAYKDKTPSQLRASGSVEERRRQLFDDYIAGMFIRRGQETGYPQQQTTHWLSWLATKMEAHSQTIYYIEWMQLDWLPKRGRWVSTIGVAIARVLAFGMLTGLIAWLLAQLGIGPSNSSPLPFGMFIGLLTGLLVGLLAWLLAWVVNDFRTIKNVERLRWRWSRKILLFGLFGGLFGKLTSAALDRTVGVLLEKLGIGTSNSGSGVGLLVGLLAGLFAGLSTDEIETKTVPNQGIRRSARNALVAGLVVGLVVGLVFELVFDMIFGVFFGLLAGLVVWGLYGGEAVLKHYALRWLLYRNGSLPLRLVPFLDYCADRIFLRKVGGGYIFVHRLLMEHFASLYTEEKAASSK